MAGRMKLTRLKWKTRDMVARHECANWLRDQGLQVWRVINFSDDLTVWEVR